MAQKSDVQRSAAALGRSSSSIDEAIEGDGAPESEGEHSVPTTATALRDGSGGGVRAAGSMSHTKSPKKTKWATAVLAASIATLRRGANVSKPTKGAA